jgi:hypothetical protein
MAPLMRLLAVLTVLVSATLASRTAHAAAALIQAPTGATGTTSVTASWTSSTGSATGELLVAILTYNKGATVGVAGGTSWQLAGSVAANGNNVSTAIYYWQNPPSGRTSETFTFTGATLSSVQLAEFTGMQSSGVLDVTGTATVTSSSVTAATSSATTTGPELAVLGFATDDNSQGRKWDSSASPFSNLGGVVSPGTIDSRYSYQLNVASNTSVSETLTIGNKSANLAAVAATFKVLVTPLYWRGGLTGCAAGSAFSSTTCWANSSGGASSGSAPTSTDTVIFDGGGTGSCALNAAASALSITMQSGYTGTITHSTGNISLGGALTVSGGTFTSTATSASSIRTNQSGTYAGDLVVSGGTFSSGGAVLAFRNISVSGSSSSLSTGTSATSTNNSGTVTLSGGSVTFGTGGLTLASTFTVSGATTSIGNAAFTAPGAVTVSSGSLSFGSGNVAFNGGLTISGTGAVTLGTGTTQTATTVTVSSTSGSALTFATGSTFSSTDVFSQSAGTVTANNATLTFGSGVAAVSDGFTLTGGTFSAGTSTLSVGSAGNSGGQTTTVNGTSANFDGYNGTQRFYGILNVTAGTVSLGSASMLSSRNGGGNANSDKQVTVGASGWLNLSSSFSFPSTVAMTIAGKINGGTGTVSFTPAVTFSGSGVYDVQQSTTTFSAAVTMSSTTSLFWGGTGTTTFSVAPTFTSGTFQVGSDGTTGSVIFTAGATFASGMTVAFPTSGGTLSAPGGQTIAINGTVTSSAGAITSRPKLARSSGATGITVAFGSTSVLNIDGLEFDNSVSTGVTIADGATYTLLKNLKFQSNVANSISTGATHLAITSSNTGGSKVLQIPGCYFDATAQYNVTLSGVSGSTGVRAVFEFQSTSVNGARGGPAYDLDADTNGDNVADTTTASRYGAVAEWVRASPSDTAGTAVGFPTAAFDWNTFQWYGVYVAFKDTTGSSTADILWNRNSDGSAAYSFSVPQTSGDIVGTPKWDTVNEVTKGVDANGDGDQLDTDVRVVYIGTSTGHIIKLVDNGSSLARPAQGAWASDFTDSNVSTITSALGNDGTNLYFGGTGSSTTKVFAVQVAGGSNEAKLVKTIGSVSAITTTPSITTSGGSTYVFLGSTATSNVAYIYRINMTNLTVDASYSGSTTNINGAVSLVNGRAYAASDGGQVYALDALNFNVGGFTNLTGFPYTTSGSAAVKNAPWVDSSQTYAYFGDDGGKVYAINSSGAALTGFPLTLSASIKITSTPIYVAWGGVIAIGANDGYLYFIDRNNGTTGPSVFRRYFVTGSGSVSNVAYNANTSTYMVSSSDGKLTFVNGSDVTDPTSSSQ